MVNAGLVCNLLDGIVEILRFLIAVVRDFIKGIASSADAGLGCDPEVIVRYPGQDVGPACRDGAVAIILCVMV